MYYVMILAAVVMFGFQFFLNDDYEKKNGNNLTSSMMFIFGSSLVGFVILLGINKFRFEFTYYTLFMAVVTALNMMACLFCSMKALARINLSLYSIFSMLGGMLLPFFAGILFYEEKLTLGKILCFIIVTLALFVTFQKGKSAKGFIYYAGIFVFNGMSGVLSKIFQESTFEKTSAAGYSVLSALMTVVIAGIILLFNIKKVSLPKRNSFLSLAGYGFLNKVANYLLLIALAHVPASTQYPMVTGGVMIVSTVLGFFTPNKPGKREIISLVLAFVGIMMLVIVP
ncbi:MAG: EamA family transporter [Clostridia bacterium]|nr:EamA family transporter [Clostridia bacterium]